MSKYDPEFFSGMKREPMTLNFIKQAIEDKAVLEALVISCDNEHTLKLNLGKGIAGEIKFNELEYNYNGSDSKVVAAISKVGKRVKFIPTDIDKQGGEYVVQCSRRLAQQDCFDNYISKLQVGDIIPAKTIKSENYGVFCDIGCGIVALLPTSCVSTTHIVNPKETLKDLGNLYVVIRSIDKDFRIQLTHKELLGTWDEEASRFSVGDVVIGTILRVEDYGYFIKLSQNLSGLAELVDDLNLKPGDRVSVKINAIMSINMKVKLEILEKLDIELEKIKFEYTKTSGHLDKWVYSTSKSNKRIETIFNN